MNEVRQALRVTVIALSLGLVAACADTTASPTPVPDSASRRQGSSELPPAPATTTTGTTDPAASASRRQGSSELPPAPATTTQGTTTGTPPSASRRRTMN